MYSLIFPFSILQLGLGSSLSTFAPWGTKRFGGLFSLAAVLPTNEMIVGSGKGELQLDLSEVEIAIF